MFGSTDLSDKGKLVGGKMACLDPISNIIVGMQPIIEIYKHIYIYTLIYIIILYIIYIINNN